MESEFDSKPHEASNETPKGTSLLLKQRQKISSAADFS